MSLTQQAETTQDTWGLDRRSLNNWLDNDIKHFTTQYPSQHVDKCSLKHIISTTYPLLPSPVLSNQEITPKRKRGNNRTPVDIIVKRQRNTDAARRSRLRKAEKLESLEKRVDTLKDNNDRLRVKVAVLETEVNHVAEKEQRNRQRVLELEALLASAHKQLVTGK